MIQVQALHHLRFGVTDLTRTEAFTSDFGLHKVSGDARELYMRSAGDDTYNYVAELGAKSCLKSIAFRVKSAADLRLAVEQYGASPMRELTGPGGGYAVTLRDPEGMAIDLVYGIATRTADELHPNLVFNFGYDKQRLNQAQSLQKKGPPQLMRLGHVGVYVKDYALCAQWYQSVLGMLPSDQMYAGSPDNKICGFFRFNLGNQPTDHHALFLAQYGKSDLHHLSFEVQDFEAQFMAHVWLKERGWESVWGVGRHTLGCHIFDVWMDPNGYRFETFTDTDQFDDHYQAGLHDAMQNPVDLWCNDPPDRYFGPMPEELKQKIAALRDKH